MAFEQRTNDNSNLNKITDLDEVYIKDGRIVKVKITLEEANILL